MKNSSSRSETLVFPAVMGVMVLIGAALQIFQMGWHWMPFAWLLATLCCLSAWTLNTRRNERYLNDIRDIAQDVAHGKFSRRIKNIPVQGRFHGLCWDINDMLDQLEACFREQATALQCASQGQYYRLASRSACVAVSTSR